VTSLKEIVRDRPLKPGDAGEIRIEIPKLPFRPGEFALTLGLGSNNFSVFEDILDANVNLPHLVIESTDDDLFGRGGVFSIDYSIRHTDTLSRPSFAKA
jgi:hypothetical protein